MVLITLVSIVPLEKLCNTTPGSREPPFHSVLPIDSLVKDIWGLSGPKSLTFSQSSNWLVLITWINMGLLIQFQAQENHLFTLF